jgi:hypothetical protein
MVRRHARSGVNSGPWWRTLGCTAVQFSSIECCRDSAPAPTWSERVRDNHAYFLERLAEADLAL